MATTTRVFVGRLAQLSVFDPLGEKLGRVRDVVVTFSTQRTRPRVIGLVIEVGSRKRIFVPMTRVISVEGGQVLTTGLVNVRRFEQRANETLVLAELVERHVQVKVGGEFGRGGVEEVSDVPKGDFDLGHGGRLSNRVRLGKNEIRARHLPVSHRARRDSDCARCHRG